MSRIFDSYKNIDKDYLPDNRPNPFNCPCKNGDTIVPGGTCYNVFDLDYLNMEIIKDCHIQLIYYQGTEFRLMKENKDFNIYDDEDRIFIEVRLDENDTVKFNEYNQDVRCQLRIKLLNLKEDESGESGDINDIVYSKIFRLKILPTLTKETIYG